MIHYRFPQRQYIPAKLYFNGNSVQTLRGRTANYLDFELLFTYN